MEKQEFSVEKIAEMLQMFGGTVRIEAGDRDNDVVSTLSNHYKKLPDLAVVRQVYRAVQVIDVVVYYAPCYTFVLGDDRHLIVEIWGLPVPTYNIAHQEVEFWKPKIEVGTTNGG